MDFNRETIERAGALILLVYCLDLQERDPERFHELLEAELERIRAAA